MGNAAMHTDEEEKAERKKTTREYGIDIFMAWCKSCGICVAFCPRKCLDQNEEGSPVVTRPDQCTGCGWCEIHCPDFAISLREVKGSEARGEEEAE
jgi:2-oxoglutarate ferredoxin oxidoreductase subunit delta